MEDYWSVQYWNGRLLVSTILKRKTIGQYNIEIEHNWSVKIILIYTQQNL